MVVAWLAGGWLLAAARFPAAMVARGDCRFAIVTLLLFGLFDAKPIYCNKDYQCTNRSIPSIRTTVHLAKLYAYLHFSGYNIRSCFVSVSASVGNYDPTENHKPENRQERLVRKTAGSTEICGATTGAGRPRRRPEFFSYRQVAVLRASHRGTDFRPRIFRGFSLLILPAPNRFRLLLDAQHFLTTTTTNDFVFTTRYYWLVGGACSIISHTSSSAFAEESKQTKTNRQKREQEEEKQGKATKRPTAGSSIKTPPPPVNHGASNYARLASPPGRNGSPKDDDETRHDGNDY